MKKMTRVRASPIDGMSRTNRQSCKVRISFQCRTAGQLARTIISHIGSFVSKLRDPRFTLSPEGRLFIYLIEHSVESSEHEVDGRSDRLDGPIGERQHFRHVSAQPFASQCRRIVRRQLE